MKTARLGSGDPGSKDLLVVLEPGDELHPCILAAAAEHGVEGGMLSAIGAIDELELGFFCLPDNVYTKRVIHDELEVVSLNGNLAMQGGKPFLHAHGVFTGRDFAPVGGHVFRAKVSITLECMIFATSRLTRVPNPAFGLTKLL
jgi:predicted DNA-binding protein with PD1-like motif